MEIIALPTLRKPVLIAAFEGWNDAGNAATAAAYDETGIVVLLTEITL